MDYRPVMEERLRVVRDNGSLEAQAVVHQILKKLDEETMVKAATDPHSCPYSLYVNGQEVPLQYGPNSIGRNVKNHVPILDERVSRLHCIICIDAKDGIMIYGLNPLNPYWKDDRTCYDKVVAIRPGEQIHLTRDLSIIVAPSKPIEDTVHSN